MTGPLTSPGWATTMVQPNWVNVPHWWRQDCIPYFTRMNILLASKHSLACCLKRSFITLSKDEDNALSHCQQVNRLLESIKMDDGELKAAKAVIHQSYADDFDGACAYFSKTVSDLHRDAQVEYQCHRGKKRNMYATGSHQHGGRGHRGCGRYGSRGRGCFGNHSVGRGRGLEETIQLPTGMVTSMV